MAFTKEQRAALEALGYTIAKSGKTIKTKDGSTIGGINENGKFFSGSKKVMDILKNPPKAEEKPASKPAKTEGKSNPRPKANPTRKPGGARPEGKASGMPAATGGRGDGAKEAERRRTDTKSGAGVPLLGVAAAGVGRGRKPTTGKPVNPSYTGRTVMPEGFQGRYATEVGRPRAGGGARVIGGNPGRRALGRSGGIGVVKMPDVLELRNMNKGGMVKKMPKTYKK